MTTTFDPILQKLRTKDTPQEELVSSSETGDVYANLQPHKLYLYNNPIDSLTITLPEYSDSISEEFHFRYTAGLNGCPLNITVPSGTLIWANGTGPTGTAEKTYEVSIQNNIGVFIEI